MERSLSGGSGIPAVLRNLILLVILSAAAVLILSADVFADNVTRIMPLGDSITKGTGSSYGWGYREPLYVSLINGGYSFDFVGGLTNGSFSDPNHEGHYGWRADEILNGRTSEPAAGKLVYWLPASQPDVILLHIGTNDIWQGNQDANEVNSILNVIDAYEVSSGKNIPVFLARIIDKYPNNPATTTYNNDLNTMATKRIANGDNIIIVNMQYAINYPADMADSLHPNDNGYAKMANVWYNALADYFGPSSLVISGYVLEADGSTPVKDVLMSAGDTNTLTDTNGYYEFSVDYGWSGVVTPEKEGYVFEPNSNTYNNVTHGYSDVNYTATLITFKIAGYVLDSDNSAPISDVNVFTENGGGPWTSRYGGGATLTDADGYYEVWVDCNWSGNVTSSKYAYVFEPNSRHYEDVNQDYSVGQNYMGSKLDLRITGYIKNECDMPIEGVLVYASNGGSEGTTDVNGFYEVWVDSAWSGVVMPTKAYCTFDPNWMSYVDVLADQPDQNYAAGNIYDLDCDGSVGWSDFEILVNNWPLTGPAVRGDFIHDGVVNFLDFAELVRVWEDE
jgi:lysophospholipase L1-like esterase